MPTRIATWNVNGLRARIDFMKLWLDERKPDVVGIQELKLTDEQFPHEEFEACGYHALVHGQKSWNGVAILSREPAELLQRGLPGQEDFGARLIEGNVAGLRFCTVYCPNGKSVEHEDYPRKLAWFDALAEHLEGRVPEGEPFVLCGDLNLCPGAIDSWNEERLGGHIFHTDEERKRFATLQERGLHDLFRLAHPELQAFSWWDYRGGSFHRNQGLRIDFLLGSEPVSAALRTIEIDRDYRKKHEGMTASDHCPVWADLEL